MTDRSTDPTADRCRDELARMELAVERRDIWLTEAGETERDLRLQLATAYEALGEVSAILQQRRQDGWEARLLGIVNAALKGKAR